MLQRYSHIRNEAKVAAIAALEGDVLTLKTPETGSESSQNPAHPAPDQLN